MNAGRSTTTSILHWDVPRHVFVTIVITWLCALGLIAGLIFTVDPYGTLNRNTLGLYFSTERQFKNAAIADYRPDTLILGFSKATYIDPGDVPGRTFNAAWSGGVPEEFLGFLDAHLSGQRVLIGLDLFMFNENYDPRREAYWGELSTERKFDYLTSISATRDSIDALYRNWKGERPTLKRDGSRATDFRDMRDAAGVVDPGSADYRGFKFSELRAGTLRQIQNLCQRRNAQCTAFISPMSGRHLRRMDEHGARRHLDRLREEVRSAFRVAHDFSEAYPSDDLYWKSDAMHYRPETARLFVRRMVGKGS